MRSTGTDCPVVARKLGNAGEAKGAGHPGLAVRSTAISREEPVSKSKPNGKPFVISKRVVWEAWQKVKANQGSRVSTRSPSRRSRRTSWGTSTSSGTGSPRGATCRRRCGRLRYRSAAGEASEYSECTVADRVAQTVVRLYLGAIAARQPDLFAHWVLPGARPQAG